jgi:threonine/homoserine/homoserine lactone efflux protein
MEVLFDMLKGFLVGICASAPLGPVAILVIQKSLGKGHKAGFVSGLGATVADTTYAMIAIFALAIVQKFIDAHESLILLVGGAVLVLVGVSMAFTNPFKNKKRRKRDMTASPKDFGQAVAMAFSNPGAVFVMFTLFAFFGLAGDAPQNWKVAPIILSVSAGSVTYWFCMSWLISRFSNRISMKTVVWINRIAGALVVIVGVALFGQGLVNVVFYGKPIL